jgi:threonine dehydratase
MEPSMALITLDEIRDAQQRIASTTVRTPMHRLSRERLHMAGYAKLSEDTPDIYLKDESAQPIRSFKLRGAYNKIASLTQDELQRGVITYSSGNHAQGVAYAARALGAHAVIVMPANAPQIKRDATAALGAEIVTVGPASKDRREKAEQLVIERGYVMVPPYDDPHIIAGQATCGIEIMEQMKWIAMPGTERKGSFVPPVSDPSQAAILVPVSGGGLLSGISAGVRLAAEAAGIQAPPVWGVEPELAGDAAESFRTRTLVEWPAEKTTRTLADGLRTQSLGQLNFEHILHFTSGIVTITEPELRSALHILLHCTQITAEPSGAVALAAALFHREELPQLSEVVCILSGGNLDPTLRDAVLAETPS